MTGREMQISFDVEIQLGNPELEIAEKPDSYTVFKYLNLAEERLIKTRYSGLNAKGESFEQTQKRIDDLRTLVKEVNITPSAGSNKPDSFEATIPSDYMFAVGEEVTISYINPLTSVPETKRVGVTNCTSDTYSRKVNDPYSEHVLHYEQALPLRLFLDDSVELITDGNYTVTNYYLRYLKYPTEIGPEVGEDSDLPEHMHSEIVSAAVTLFLEASADQRYQSNKNELREQE